ncbi:hypothetical protein PV08_02825 [Exophiala spinifera]|uniref:Xylanolytic transcriptional activator regulatory domain-containing protein n=1 Tax=Exophiala spinifera TaxID=91928 RepID=A0A0D2A0R0_9EURO|nr:uncharacterized protein PV08_02825 [Exophiala spinifera]KIW18537.1 hypothetical protein PV08_02825 [Exophiala spinifera]
MGSAETRRIKQSTSSAWVSPERVNHTNDRIDNVESRLNQMELRMDQFIKGMSSKDTSTAAYQHHEPPQVSLPEEYHPDQYILDFDHINLDQVNQLLSQQQSSLPPSSEQIISSDYDLAADEPVPIVDSSYPSLPPLTTIQPAIEVYFAHQNSLIPLFSQSTFLRMLQDYYSFNSRYPRTAWAAINVVLALAARLPASPSNDLDLGPGDSQVAKNVNNALSVLAELVTGEVELLGLQVIIGLVIIFNALKDSRPAVVLIGMAVRLAHRLRLHIREGQDSLSVDEMLQRSRVFWITYIFDKDICLRHHTPSVQADGAIDVDLPSEHPPDDVGIVHTTDGRTSVNFFRLRVRLAYIQGRVYDLLFATQATKITPQERRARIAFLHNQLEQWRRTVPPELQANVVVNHVNRAALLWLCMMHFSYLGCLVMIHGIWSFDAEWRSRLTTRHDNIDVSIAANGQNSNLTTPTPPPLPRGWRNCVLMSRNCMVMISKMSLSDCSVWANGCAYFSALLILEANVFESPLDENVDSDLQLTGSAVGILNRMSEASTLMAMKRMNVVASELDRRARQVVHEARQNARAPRVRSDPRYQTPKMPLSSQTSPAQLQWDWANSGVEAWPGMDFSLKENTISLPSIDMFDIALGLGPFGEWNNVQMDNLFDTDHFAELTALLEPM